MEQGTEGLVPSRLWEEGLEGSENTWWRESRARPTSLSADRVALSLGFAFETGMRASSG